MVCQRPEIQATRREQIRESGALAVSGLLSEKMSWQKCDASTNRIMVNGTTVYNGESWKTSEGEERYPEIGNTPT